MKEQQRTLNLDLIRILAAVMVLLCHTGQRLGGITQQLTAVGAKGVECFFILSGFLAFQSLEKSDNMQTYWIKRAIHIIPIYYIVLIVQQLFDIFYAHFFQGQSWIAILSWGGIGGLQNIRFFTFTNMVLPSYSWWTWNTKYGIWTINVFVIFYFIAPLLYRLFKKFWWAYGAFLVLACLRDKIANYIMYLLKDLPEDSHIEWFSKMTPVNEMYCFFLGIAVFWAIREGKDYLLIFLGVLALIFGTFKWYPYEIVFSVLIWGGAKLPPLYQGNKLKGAITFLAEGSLSLYLWHMLVLKIWWTWCGGLPKYLSALLCLTVIFIVSYIFFYFIERPIEKKLMNTYYRKFVNRA